MRKTGLGLGIGLGIPVVGSAIALAWLFLRAKKVKARKNASNDSPTITSGTTNNQFSGRLSPTKQPTQHPEIAEMDGDEVQLIEYRYQKPNKWRTRDASADEICDSETAELE